MTNDWPFRALLARVAGITEVDVRSYQLRPNFDIVEVRLWNHRRIEVRGIDILRAVRP